MYLFEHPLFMECSIFWVCVCYCFGNYYFWVFCYSHNKRSSCYSCRVCYYNRRLLIIIIEYIQSPESYINEMIKEVRTIWSVVWQFSCILASCIWSIFSLFEDVFATISSQIFDCSIECIFRVCICKLIYLAAKYYVFEISDIPCDDITIVRC